MARLAVHVRPETVSIGSSLFGWELCDQNGYNIGIPMPKRYPDEKPYQRPRFFKTPLDAMRFSDRHFGTRFCREAADE